jgi:hypothetical protein
VKAHAQYLAYVLRHKFFVYQEGRKLGVSRLQLILHDFQKFSPAEWSPYVAMFYGDDPEAAEDAFDRAWLHHQKLGGKHHWQWHILPLDDGGFKALAMPDRYRREMLADWKGAGRALGKSDTKAWYLANRDRIVLHPDTRLWAEEALECAS